MARSTDLPLVTYHKQVKVVHTHVHHLLYIIYVCLHLIARIYRCLWADFQHLKGDRQLHVDQTSHLLTFESTFDRQIAGHDCQACSNGVTALILVILAPLIVSKLTSVARDKCQASTFAGWVYQS